MAFSIDFITGKLSIPPPRWPNRMIRLSGYGPGHSDSIEILCGDEPPTVTGGYAKWDVVDRPLQRGMTVFRGADPTQLTINLRFGVWTHDGWLKDKATGFNVEEQIQSLEWMAGGGQFTYGQSPTVYAKTVNKYETSTNLIPESYQTTQGIFGSNVAQDSWPWIFNNGIQWGKAFRIDKDGTSADRVYQECSFTLTNFTGTNGVAKTKTSGRWYTTTPERHTLLAIAADPLLGPALYVDQLVQRIKNDPKNNPMPHSRIHLKTKGKYWNIPLHKAVWVPAHTV